MILTEEKIIEIAKGVESWDYGPEGGLIPQRFSCDQRQAYRVEEDRYLRTQATAGVRLDCRTDAVAIELSMRAFPGSARDWYDLDLVVDRSLTGHVGGTLGESDRIFWTHPLPVGEKRMTLYLPCLTGVEILKVELKDATFCHPVAQKEKILFMGDSITQGYTSHFPSLTYVAQVAAARNADYLNQGNGGEIFRPEVLKKHDWKPTMAVIAYGSNDWSQTDREQFTRNAGEFLEHFCRVWPDVPTAVVTPIWRADYLSRREDDFSFAEARGVLERLAVQHRQMRVVSGEELLPQVSALMEDGRIHPNEIGFTVYAKNLTEKLDTLYPSKSKVEQ